MKPEGYKEYSKKQEIRYQQNAGIESGRGQALLKNNQETIYGNKKQQEGEQGFAGISSFFFHSIYLLFLLPV
jgi:hypothetical protein